MKEFKYKLKRLLLTIKVLAMKLPFYVKLFFCRKNKKQPVGLSYIDARQESTSVLDVDLLDKNTSTKEKKKARQYSKVIVTFFCIMSAIWVTLSYCLAGYALVVYGSVEVLQDLSKEICITIIAVFVSYFAKAYLESFSSAKHDLDVMMLRKNNYEENKDEPVG